MMPNFKPRLGTKFQAQTAPVNDGQFIVATDSERASILAPLPKFYFVIATGKLYVWDGTIWTIINDDPFDENSLPPAGSLPTLLFVKHGKIRSLKLGDEGDILTVRNGEIVWEPPQYQ